MHWKELTCSLHFYPHLVGGKYQRNCRIKLRIIWFDNSEAKKISGLPKGLFIWQAFMFSSRNKLLSPYHSLSIWEAFIIRRSSGRSCDSRSMKTKHFIMCFGISVSFRTSWNNLKQLTTPLAKMRRHKKRWVLPQRHSIIVRV